MNLLKSSLRKPFIVIVSLFISGAFSSLFAQTADVRYAGVFYKESPTTVKEMYCEWDTGKTGIDAAGASTSTAQRSIVPCPAMTLTLTKFRIRGSVRP